MSFKTSHLSFYKTMKFKKKLKEHKKSYNKKILKK